MTERPIDTAYTFRIGPFLTTAGAVATGLTIAQADIRLSKAGGDFAQTANTGGATHDENGWYSLTLNDTDFNTAGELEVSINVSGAMPVWKTFVVVTANYYDSKYLGTDSFNVSVAELPTASVTEATCNKIADHVHRRTLANIEASSNGDAIVADGRSSYEMLCRLLNYWYESGGSLYFHQSDDATVIATVPVTTSTSVAPIISMGTPGA